MRQIKSEILPVSLPPMGINREQAAAFIGISATLYDRCVEAGTMPAPRVIGGRQVYDVEELIRAFRQLPHKNGRFGELDDSVTTGNAFDNAKKAQ